MYFNAGPRFPVKDLILNLFLVHTQNIFISGCCAQWSLLADSWDPMECQESNQSQIPYLRQILYPLYSLFSPIINLNKKLQEEIGLWCVYGGGTVREDGKSSDGSRKWGSGRRERRDLSPLVLAKMISVLVLEQNLFCFLKKKDYGLSTSNYHHINACWGSGCFLLSFVNLIRLRVDHFEKIFV